MGKRGPMPSENPQRTNAESQPHPVIDDPRIVIETPELGVYRWEVKETQGFGAHKTSYLVVMEFDYGDHAREMWDTVWSSPLAKQFRPETMDALWRWVKLVDRFHEHGDRSVNKELLGLEKEYGLTWSAQKRERLVFWSGDEAEEPVASEDDDAEFEPVRSDAERRQRIHAVGS